MPTKRVLDPVGTVVLCENGHAVCEVIRDLHKGDTNYSTHVGKWREGQTPAQVGQLLPLRCKCGGVYFNDPLKRFPYTLGPEIALTTLVSQMNQFIADQPSNDRDDWYVSSQEAAESIITQFAEYLGITLEEKSSATTTKENLP